MSEVFREYTFDAAHHLTSGIPDKHKCRRYHGHRYELTIFLEGDEDEHGLVIEFSILDRDVKPIIELADHHDFNTLSQRCSTEQAILVSANPTAERIVRWFATRLAFLESAAGSRRLRLSEMYLKESARSGARWRP